MTRQVVGIRHGVNVKVSQTRRLFEEREPEVKLKTAREQADTRLIEYYVRRAGLN